MFKLIKDNSENNDVRRYINDLLSILSNGAEGNISGVSEGSDTVSGNTREVKRGIPPRGHANSTNDNILGAQRHTTPLNTTGGHVNRSGGRMNNYIIKSNGSNNDTSYCNKCPRNERKIKNGPTQDIQWKAYKGDPCLFEIDNMSTDLMSTYSDNHYSFPSAVSHSSHVFPKFYPKSSNLNSLDRFPEMNYRSSAVFSSPAYLDQMSNVHEMVEEVIDTYGSKLVLKAEKLVINVQTSKSDMLLMDKCLKLLKWRTTVGEICDLYWSGTGTTIEQMRILIETYKSINYKYIVVNRYPNMQEITEKSHFSKTIRFYRMYSGMDIKGYPSSFIIPNDLDNIISLLKCRIPLILKPFNGSMGHGIKVVTVPEELDLSMDDYIAQEYITNPLLIDGKKFDIRIYLLILDIGDDYKAFLSKSSLVRVCTELYKYPCITNCNNNYIHLTNYSINKFNATNFYRSNDINDSKNNKRPLPSVFKYLSEVGYDVEDIWKQITNISSIIASSIYPQLYVNHISTTYNKRKCKYFQILGLDIIIDIYGKAWLLEANSNPSLNTSYFNGRIIKEDPVDISVKLPLMKNTLTLAHKLLEGHMGKISQEWDRLKIIIPDDIKSFMLLYIKAKNNNWSKCVITKSQWIYFMVSTKMINILEAININNRRKDDKIYSNGRKTLIRLYKKYKSEDGLRFNDFILLLEKVALIIYEHIICLNPTGLGEISKKYNLTHHLLSIWSVDEPHNDSNILITRKLLSFLELTSN